MPETRGTHITNTFPFSQRVIRGYTRTVERDPKQGQPGQQGEVIGVRVVSGSLTVEIS